MTKKNTNTKPAEVITKPEAEAKAEAAAAVMEAKAEAVTKPAEAAEEAPEKILLYKRIISEWCVLPHTIRKAPPKDAPEGTEGEIKRIDADISDKLFHSSAWFASVYDDGTEAEDDAEKPLSVYFDDFGSAAKELSGKISALRLKMEAVTREAEASEAKKKAAEAAIKAARKARDFAKVASEEEAAEAEAAAEAAEAKAAEARAEAAAKAITRKAREACKPALQAAFDIIMRSAGSAESVKVSSADLWEIFHTSARLSRDLTAYQVETKNDLLKAVFGVLRRRFMEKGFAFRPSDSFKKELKKAAEAAEEKKLSAGKKLEKPEEGKPEK